MDDPDFERARDELLYILADYFVDELGDVAERYLNIADEIGRSGRN